jgi:FtsZ-interacting cell division protein ZipA
MHIIIIIIIVVVICIVAYGVWRVRAHQRKLHHDAVMDAWREALSDPNLGRWKQAVPLSEEEADRLYEEHKKSLSREQGHAGNTTTETPVP